MVSSKAKEKTRKSLLKFGLTRTGAYVIACLISMKDLLASIFHFIAWSFFNILVIFIKTSIKLGINLLKKFTFPMNDCTSFLLLGSSTF